jgi:hypothetical protein
MDLLGTSTADALAAPTEPNLTLPQQVATRAALDASPGEPTPWPELEDEATIRGLGLGVVESLGLVFLALAALVAGIVFGVGRVRSEARDGGGLSDSAGDESAASARDDESKSSVAPKDDAGYGDSADTDVHHGAPGDDSLTDGE